SRRRHTRWPRDWSSDVCSSDLAVQVLVNENLLALRRRQLGDVVERGIPEAAVGRVALDFLAPELRLVGERTKALPAFPEARQQRSEERRVGKECRSGWSSDV